MADHEDLEDQNQNQNIEKRDAGDLGTRVTGTVKWYNEDRGYGFIAQDVGPDILVHFSSHISSDGYKNLVEGQRVQYYAENGQKGIQAANVTVI